jgi:decaprenyl-phosphate phosphoribosyltransferase
VTVSDVVIYVPSLWKGLVQAVRPRQWAKNVLVLAAPGAAGVLGEARVDVDVAFAIVAFCLVSSATYLLNDARDLNADRLHPTKRCRPVASGIVPVWLAVGLGITLGSVGLIVATYVRWEVTVTLGVYLMLTVSYTIWLKSVVIADVVVVALGFVARAVAGGVAADVALSRWFLIVASFGSLFVVAGKRHGEYLVMGPERGSTRATLGAYPLEYLRFVWATAATVTVTAYCLWAFQQANLHGAAVLYQLTIVPFLLFILRYALLIELGKGSAPEDAVLGDRSLQIIALLWTVVFASAIYVGH